MKLLEYLKLVPKGLPNSIAIIQGIINNVQLENLPEEERDVIIKRRICCTTCPFNNVNAKTSPEYFQLTTTHYKTKRNDDHCAMCFCPIKTKTASLHVDCGLSSWNESHPDKQIELKWRAIL